MAKRTDTLQMILKPIIVGRNHAEYTEKCLSSILDQEGKFTLDLDWYDDASDDYKGQEIANRIAGWQSVISNEIRIGGLANFWRSIEEAEPDDILFFMGGDDWILPGAFERLVRIYQDENTWMTYGTYALSNGRVTQNMREWDGCDLRAMTHDFLWMPLTCRAWLAKKVCEDDLKLGGFFQQSSGDVALNIPIVEMAGPEHARMIPDVWYIRRIHENNDDQVDRGFQQYCTWKSYGRPRYSRITGKEDMPKRETHRMKWGLRFEPDGNGNKSMPVGVIYEYEDER